MRAAPWAVLDALATALYGLIFLLVVGLFVGPANLGLASTALAFVLLMDAVASAWMQDVVIRLPSAETRQTDAAQSLAVGLSFVGMPIVWGLAYGYGTLFSEPDLPPLAIFASLILPLNAVAVVPTAMLIRKMRGPQLLYRPVIGKILGILALTVFAWMGAQAWAVVAGSVFTSLGGALALFIAATRWPKLRWNRNVARAHLRFGLFSGSDNLLWMVSGRLLTLSFASAFGMRALGYLQLAMRLVDEISRLLQSIMMRYALALFASYKRASSSDGHAETGRALILTTRLMNALGAPAFIGIATVGDLFVERLFGEKWQASAFFIQVLAVAASLTFARLLVSPALKAVNRPDLVAFAATANFLTALAVIAATAFADARLLVILWGAREIVALIIWYRLAHGALGVRYRDLIGALVPTWASGLLMAAVLLLLRQTLAPDHTTIDLAALIGSGALVYGASLFACERKWALDFLRVRHRSKAITDGAIKAELKEQV